MIRWILGCLVVFLFVGCLDPNDIYPAYMRDTDGVAKDGYRIYCGEGPKRLKSCNKVMHTFCKDSGHNFISTSNPVIKGSGFWIYFICKHEVEGDK